MRKGLKVLLGLLGLVGVWLALVLTEWLPPETALERESVAAVEAPHPNVAGTRNAFAALQVFGLDVPPGEIESAVAGDVKAYAEFAAHRQDKPFEAPSAQKFAKLPVPAAADGPILCEGWKDDCLTRVRANREVVRERLARFEKIAAHGDALADYDYYHYEFVRRVDSPGLTLAGLPQVFQTRVALDYADGKVDAAFARVCRDVRTWRTLRAHADMLIVDMIGVAMMSNGARLYAQMLAEQPPTFAPPCTDVFAPLADAELDQCAVFAFEYDTLKRTFQDAMEEAAIGNEPDLKSAITDKLVNKRHVIAGGAVANARYCLPAHRDRAHRRSGEALDSAPTCGAFAYAFDPVGCLLTQIAIPVYDDYYLRVLDLDARMKLVQSVVWLRAQPADGDRRAQFEARPDTLKSPANETRIDPDKALLSMVPFDKRRGATWDIPYAAPKAAPPLVD